MSGSESLPRRPHPLLVQNEDFGYDEFALTVHRPGQDAVVVQVVGELDMLTAPRLESVVFDELTAKALVVVLDLREVTFLGCSGLRVLVTIRQAAARSATSLRLVCQSRTVVRPLSLVGLADLFFPGANPDFPPAELPDHAAAQPQSS